MNISMINGSPKMGKSTSGLMIEHLMPFIEENEIQVYKVSDMDFAEAQFDKIISSDILIFAFPLYVDSLPAQLLRILMELEKRKFAKKAMVYCISNNGFFEGKQNHIALEQMKHWCKSAGLIWGQGVGVGAGEMQPFLKDIPLGYGPNKNIGKAFKELAENIARSTGGRDLFVSPNWPRLLWRIQSSLLFWYPRAKKNGLKRKNMYRKI